MSFQTVAPPSSLRALYESEFYLLGVDSERGAALLQRKASAFSDLSALLAENERVIAKLRECAIGGIVIDMRAAPPNNDPRFEAGMRGLRDALRHVFARVVVLVVTAVGELQMNRIHSHEHSGFSVTRSSLDAWRLAGGD